MNYSEPIETFEGGGMVLQGDTEVGPARYYLVVQREMLDAGHHGDADAETPGMYRISGSVELLGDGQFGARFDLVWETLTSVSKTTGGLTLCGRTYSARQKQPEPSTIPDLCRG